MLRLTSSTYHHPIAVPNLRHFLRHFIRLLFSALMLHFQVFLPAQSGGGGGDILSTNVELTCTGIVVHFSGNPNWPTHHWDFGDGSPVVSGGPELANVDHVYQDINPFDMPITPLHSLDGNTWNPVTISFPGITIGSGCGSVRLLSDLVNSGILPTNILDNADLYIFGDLEVDIPYTFTLSNINVIPGGTIKIKQGGRLTLNPFANLDALRVSICDWMWNGIEVQSGGVLATNLATIQNAYYGIRPIHTPGATTVPSLFLYNASFKRNFIGICADSGPFFVGAFSGNVFEGSGNNNILSLGACNLPTAPTGIPFTQRTYCGIYFNGESGGQLSLPTAAVLPNLFKDLQAGIVCKNGDATIRSCQFENILTIAGNGAPYQGTAISFLEKTGNHKLTVRGLGKTGTTTMFNCERGIHANAAVGLTNVTINHCRMESVQNGVTLDEGAMGNFGTVEIMENAIQCSKYFSAHGVITSTGINVQDPNPWYSMIVIEGNEIEVNQYSAFFPSPGANLTLNPTGIRIVGMMPQVGIPSSNSMALHLKNNEIFLKYGYDGIFLKNVVNSNVDFNNVENSNLQIANYTELFGISIEGGIQNSAKCNTISSVAQSGTFNYMGGIYSDGSTNCQILGNSITDMQACISLLNDNGTDCDIRNNDIINQSATSVGLYYNDALTGPQYLNGNRWINNFDIGAAFENGPNAFSYCDSRFDVGQFANIAGSSPNSVIVPSMQSCGDWFTVLSLAEAHYPCTQPSPPYSPARNEADMHLASAGGTSALSVGFKWSAEMGLYRKFTEMPELIESDPVITGFLEMQTGQPVAQMYAVRKEFVNLYDNPGLEGQLQNIRQQGDALRAAMDALQPTIEANPEALLDWTTLNNQLLILEQDAELLLDQWEAAIVTAATAVRTDNNAINCPGQPCANEQYLYDLFLETQVTSPRVLSTGEEAQVKAIAETCPSEGGPAVYLARSWYFLLTGIILENNCSGPLPVTERRENRQLEPTLEFTIVPNPTRDWVAVKFPDMDEATEICIRDSWGRIVKDIQTSGSPQNEIQLSTTELVSGCYTVSLVSASGKLIFCKKLVVVH
ncbi:MAG: right-handed parallel beta-helix repeat-containing protein [Saprospiraceae bacterium]